jgi:Arc/MetJ family transcription regulator
MGTLNVLSHMKTTLDIDKDLLNEAKEVLGAATIKETVHASLEAVVRRRKLQALADAFGTVPFDMSPEDVRRQRRKRAPHVSR